MPPKTREEAFADPAFKALDADVQAEVQSRLPSKAALTARGSQAGEQALRESVEGQTAAFRERLGQASIGDVGTVVEILDPDAAEVEFLDRDGRTRCVVTLPVNHVLVLNRDRTPVR